MQQINRNRNAIAAVMAVAVLAVASMFAVSLMSEDSTDGYTGEAYALSDEGWYCVLYSDGTAWIIGVGVHTYYTPCSATTTAMSEHTCGYVSVIPCGYDDDGNMISIEDDPTLYDDDGYPMFITKTVTVGDVEYTVTGLGDSLFYGKNTTTYNVGDHLTYVFIPNTIEYIGEKCFMYNQAYYMTNKKVEVEDTGFTVEFEDDSNLKEIGSQAFYYCGRGTTYYGLESITLPSSVTTIGTAAFGYDLTLETVNFECDENGNYALTTIDDRAFYNCTSLTLTDSLYAVLEQITSLGVNAFYSCTSLVNDEDSTLVLSNVEKASRTSFSGCTNLYYRFDGTVKTYDVTNDSGTYTLLEEDGEIYVITTTATTEVVIPAEVTVIESGVFDATVVESVSFEEGSQLVLIDSKAFYVATTSSSTATIQTLDFTNATKLESIGTYAFTCAKITTLDLSACTVLTEIDSYAFSTSTVEVLTLPDSIVTIGNSAFSSTVLTELYASFANVTTIGTYAFSSSSTCLLTTELSFAGSPLVSVGEKAFYYKLDEDAVVDLSYCTSLTTIGKNAFTNATVNLSGCSSLTSVATSAFVAVIFDENTSCIHTSSNSIQTVGRTSSKVDGVTVYTFTIEETDYAIIQSYLNARVIEIINEGDHFIFDGTVLLSPDGTTLLKVLYGATDVVIPDTVTSINQYAFSYCTSIETITISSSMDVSTLSSYTDAEIFVVGSLTDVVEDLDSMGLSYTLVYEVGDYSIYFETEIGLKYAFPTVTVDSEGTAVVTMSYSGGYTDYDVYLTDGTSVYASSQWEFALTGDLTLTICAYDRTADVVAVTLDANGGEFSDGSETYLVAIASGRTFLDSDIVYPTRTYYSLVTWYTVSEDGTVAEYDFDTPVTEAVTLYAEWEYIGYTIYYDCANGAILATVDGETLSSGDQCNGTVTLAYYPSTGYEMLYWIVNGEEYYDAVLTIEVTEDIYVEVETDSYSADSLRYIITDTGVGDIDDYSLAWYFGGSVDTSMSTWSGMVSVPTVVGDYVYVRVSDHLYKVSIDTGLVEASVISVTSTDYYHYVGYGNGMIVDYATSVVYDLDLNALFTLDGDIEYAHYENGYFYCLSDGKLVAYDATDVEGEVETKAAVWSSAATDWFTLYGTVSEPVFVGGYVYIIEVDGSSIFLKAYDLDDGSLSDSVELTTIYGHYLDDGWLTYYDGTLYLTSYAYGLFGATSTTYTVSVITSVDVKNGTFDDDSLTYTELTDGTNTFNSLTSQLVIYNGRGYVNSYVKGGSAYLLVLDMSDMSVIYSVKTTSTHGSIVVDASAATEENDYLVTIYMLSYSSGELYYVQDTASATSGKAVATGISGTYCSQGIRVSDDGDLLWYDDSGVLYCYSMNVEKYVLVEGSETSVWYSSTESTATDAVAGIDAIEYDETSAEILSVNGDSDSTWHVYGLTYELTSAYGAVYSWVEITLGDSTYDSYRYIIVTTAESADDLPADGDYYSYVDDDGDVQLYEFYMGVGDSDVIGRELTAGVDVVSVSFYDTFTGEEVLVDAVLVVSGGTTTLDLPTLYNAGYSYAWVDADGNAVTGSVTLTENTSYYTSWVEIAYDVDAEVTESSGLLYFEFSVVRSAGSEDVDDLSIIVVAEYEGGIYVNMYQTVGSGDEVSTIVMGLSSTGLESVHAYVVSGFVTGAFSYYGSYSYDVEESE